MPVGLEQQRRVCIHIPSMCRYFEERAYPAYDTRLCATGNTKVMKSGHKLLEVGQGETSATNVFSSLRYAASLRVGRVSGHEFSLSPFQASDTCSNLQEVCPIPEECAYSRQTLREYNKMPPLEPQAGALTRQMAQPDNHCDPAIGEGHAMGNACFDVGQQRRHGLRPHKIAENHSTPPSRASTKASAHIAASFPSSIEFTKYKGRSFRGTAFRTVPAR